uniref:Rubrerythrin n=1 Tax=uncultured organism TaxID=155900 RepID=M1Q2V3_9ZZZZ|nr:rubrerythrin [uncultured organism]
MDIYQFAINFERENREYYEDLAEKSESERIKNVFLELASEEAKHERIVKQLRDKEDVEDLEFDIIPKVNEVFEDIKSDMPDSMMPKDQVDVYKKALNMEEKSKDFYSEKAEEVSGQKVKEVLKRLAKEEKKHEDIVRSIIELVNRPDTWLEDAEWYHLEDY